jgi:hypothetical protein
MPSINVASGHDATSIGSTHIDTFGFGPMMIREGKRTWFFEFSEMFGPSVLRRDGRHFEIADKQPISERDPFWQPFQRWMEGGRKVRAIKTKRGRIRFYLCHAPKKNT